MPMEINTQSEKAKQVARHLIYRYIERGNPIEWLNDMGEGSIDYDAFIGGWANEKKYSNDFIVVTRVDRQECLYVFSKKQIYNEIYQELHYGKQQTLF